VELKHDYEPGQFNMADSFNRTIVELKLGTSSLRARLIQSFNRTIVELKPGARKTMRIGISFNRTIVELKRTLLS